MKNKSIWILSLAIIVMALAVAVGCATQKLSDQTDDPVILATAVYYDALNIYNETLSSYLPYKEIVERSNPDRAAQIKYAFQDANDMLDQWKVFAQLGQIAQMDPAKFHEWRRTTLLMLAEELEK